MSGDPELNPTAASLLGFLHDDAMTGWDLVVAAEERIGPFWTLTRSQVYRELARLHDRGLITAEAPGPRDRKPYRITEAGRAEFATWIDTDPAGEHVRFPLLVTLAFAQHLPAGRLHEILAAHRHAHQRRLDDYESLDQQLRSAGDRVAPYRRATLEFGLHYERAVIAWFDQLPDLLPALTAADPDHQEPQRKPGDRAASGY